MGRGLHVRGHGKHRSHAGRPGGRPPGLGGVVHHRGSGGRARGKRTLNSLDYLVVLIGVCGEGGGCCCGFSLLG